MGPDSAFLTSSWWRWNCSSYWPYRQHTYREQGWKILLEYRETKATRRKMVGRMNIEYISNLLEICLGKNKIKNNNQIKLLNLRRGDKNEETVFQVVWKLLKETYLDRFLNFNGITHTLKHTDPGHKTTAQRETWSEKGGMEQKDDLRLSPYYTLGTNKCQFVKRL